MNNLILIIEILIAVVMVVFITLYSTWLLINKLKKEDSKVKSFTEWVKHIFEAIWGL